MSRQPGPKCLAAVSAVIVSVSVGAIPVGPQVSDTPAEIAHSVISASGGVTL